jgi:hypothetical protein
MLDPKSVSHRRAQTRMVVILARRASERRALVSRTRL